MSRINLMNRMRRIELMREEDGLERYVICPIPYGEPTTEGWERDPPMTDDEWEAKHCNAPRS